jgi:hypothetical protein
MRGHSRTYEQQPPKTIDRIMTHSPAELSMSPVTKPRSTIVLTVCVVKVQGTTSKVDSPPDKGCGVPHLDHVEIAC